MRITFGIHQGKTVKSLSTDKLQAFSNWLEENPVPKDAPARWRVERAHLVSSIDRELAQRDDETEDEDTTFTEGPVPLGKLLTSGETRVFLGLVFLLERNGGQQPFPATFESYADVLGGSKTSWASARQKLMEHGFLIEESRGSIAFVDPRERTEAVPYCLKPLSLLCFLVGDSNSNTLYSGTVQPVYETVEQALAILGAQNSVDEVFKAEARKKLRKLLSGSRGYTTRDAIAVAQWGRRMYDTGEERWHKMVDLLYLWNPTHFAAALIAAQAAPARKLGIGGVDTPEDRAAFKSEMDAKMRRMGLIK